MKLTMKLVALVLLVCFMAGTLASCASTTVINSTPPGAKVYMDSQYMGVTPYTYTDKKIVGSSTQISLKKEGYQDFNTTLSRTEQLDAGALIGGLFVWVPLLWIMKYNPTHNYELQPAK